MMKNKQAAMMIAAALCLTSLTGCSAKAENQNTEAQETAEEEAEAASGNQEARKASEEGIYGEVVSVSEDSLTIALGTMLERGMEGEPEGEPEGKSEESAEEVQESGSEEPENREEAPSILTLTGEEQTIALTEDTVLRKQGMGQPGGGMGEAPGEPEGEEAGEIPEMPEGGEAGEAPEMPEEEISWEELSEGDTVEIILDENGKAATVTLLTMEMGQPGGGQSQKPEEYQAVTDYSENAETEGETYSSTEADENAAHVSQGAEVVLKNAQITRNSEESTGGDSSSFYGIGAALLASDGKAYVSGGTVTTDAAGGAGLFAYDTGVVYAADTKITTEQDTSGGIHAAGGGTLYAWDLDVTTEGESSAAIRSDRGGGTMVVSGGSYTSNGNGSPAVYCTADIAVSQAELTANGSEAVCIEGLNSLHLYDCDLTGNMSDDPRNDCTWNVILYQSMSGDSQVGNSTFEMTGGSLTGNNGGMFYTTNTESTITLADVEIISPEDCEYFLKCTGNANERGWGKEGENGADCLFTAISQKIQGDIIWDSTVEELYSEGTIVDEDGKTVTIQGTDGTVYVDGDSEYTITTAVYEEAADCSGAAAGTDWAQYQVEKPEEL